MMILAEYLSKFIPLVCFENEDGSGTPAPSEPSETDAEKAALDEVNKSLNPHEDALYNDDGTAKKPEDEQTDDDEKTKSDSDGKDREEEEDKKTNEDDEETPVSKNGVPKPEDLKTVPDDGKYYIEIPEDMEMDTELLESVSGLWKEKGVTHEEAQTLANSYIENLNAKAGQAQEDAFQQREDDIDAWVKETRSDKEIGGDKLETSLTNGRKALDKFGSDELKSLLEKSGYGSNVHFIRFMSRVGAALGEDDIPGGDPAKIDTDDVPIEEQLYTTTTTG